MNCFAGCALAAVVGGVLLVAQLGVCVAQNTPEEPHYKCDTDGVQLEGMADGADVLRTAWFRGNSF